MTQQGVDLGLPQVRWRLAPLLMRLRLIRHQPRPSGPGPARQSIAIGSARPADVSKTPCADRDTSPGAALPRAIRTVTPPPVHCFVRSAHPYETGPRTPRGPRDGPCVRQRDPAGTARRVPQRYRPPVLEERHHGHRAWRDHIGRCPRRFFTAASLKLLTAVTTLARSGRSEVISSEEGLEGSASLRLSVRRVTT
jgi:hypothetical protein